MEVVNFYKTFLFLNYGMLSLLVLLLFWKFTKLSKVERLYAYYVIFLFSTEALNLFCIYILDAEDTSFIYPYYIAVEFFLLTHLLIKKLNLSGYFSLISLSIALIFLFLDKFPGILINKDEVKVASNIIIICFAGFSLLRGIQTGQSFNKFNAIDAFIFFYYSVSVFIFIIQQQLQHMSADDYYLILGINAALASILYSSIIYTFLKLKK